jgi:RNA polymerase sigma-70 factor, ECF subfamily
MRKDRDSEARSRSLYLAPDHELIERVLAGESEHYAMLVRRYQERLYRHALGMVLDGDAAADLVQDSFVKAYESLTKCRDRQRFGTWIFRILRNRCLDYLKQRRRRDSSLHDHHDVPAESGGPESDLENRLLGDVLESALGCLPQSQREAFLLKHVHDLNYEEMADIAGASVSALRMRVMRARDTLQSILAEEMRSRTGRM